MNTPQTVLLVFISGCLFSCSSEKKNGDINLLDQGVSDILPAQRDGSPMLIDAGIGDQQMPSKDMANGKKYLMQEFWPLQPGNTWTYLKSNDVSYSQTVAGNETINNVSAIKIEDTFNESGKNYALWTNDQEGYKRYKTVTNATGVGYSIELLFDPVFAYYPYQIVEGVSYKQTHAYTSKDNENHDGVGTIEEELTLGGLEKISVKAGSFDVCLKLAINTINSVTVGSAPPVTESRQSTYWFCQNVGPVKMTHNIQWNIGGSQTIEEELQSAQVNGVAYGQ